MPLKTRSLAVCVLLRRPDCTSPKICEHGRIRKSLFYKESTMTFNGIYKVVITLHAPVQFRKCFLLIPGAAPYVDFLSTAVANGSSATPLDDV